MINSRNNKQIKNIMSLIKQSKERKKQKKYVVEGEKMILEIPSIHIEKMYYSQSYYNEKGLINQDVPYDCIEDGIFNTISDTMTPQGVLGIIKQKVYALEDLLVSDQPVLIALENVQDPGNIGTIIRTAEGAGLNGVILTKDCVDIYNPKVVRSTMGSLHRVPFFITENIKDTLSHLKNKSIKVVAAHLKGNALYDEVDYKNNGVVFLIGNESKGLSESTALESDVWIKIPLHGQVESLNASVAASLLMYEAERQRR
ncbi:TrmH family RNA methyltransferase [Natranaerovirga hydrolytica]|uniref:TrmH family RNA methyltransferase n=1 Tax=Natranaerovirga hydrolytica TaxID=680378 RepID=A0A4R1MEK9_9FIRM|nr:RNA methyltransferase [Natranaerovirga hydrolytica]TCK90567.1 TrmH family RNA methyltransferase [Natranaerovirga hydrolytica]